MSYHKRKIMKDYNFETEAVRTQTERTQFSEHSTPLYLTSSFVFDDAEDMRASFAEEKEKNLYSRFSNPNTTEFVSKVVKMEGAEDGYAFATGMAAIFSTLATLLDSGDHIVSSRSVFGSTHALFTKYLPKWNIETSYFDGTKAADKKCPECGDPEGLIYEEGCLKCKSCGHSKCG